ncbi:MAG: hypothetical protein AABW73_03320 [Nanoarchaeota archaeon]
MEDLKKQGGEKARKMESKIDSKSPTHTKPVDKIKEKVEEQIVKEMAKEIKAEATTDETKPATETKVTEKKEAKKPAVKKEMAFVRMNGLSMSTKQSREICRFLMGKTVDKAIEDMTKVTKMKIAVPMRGEIPHRKGDIMAGRYPINTARVFINVLKSLAGNANVNGIANPVITIASASWAARPQRKGGRRFKRTHLYMEVREAKNYVKENNNKKMHNKTKTMDGKK